MCVNDIIQILALVVLAGTLIITLRQVIIQNRLFKAQLFRDRFEMYMKTYEPTSEGEIRQLEDYPDDYMDRELYETIYKGNPRAIRKYINMSYLYEYHAFIHALKTLKLPDPIGYAGSELWVKDLTDDKEFVSVHNYYKPYYPEFAKYIDALIRNKQGNPETEKGDK